MKRHLVCLFLCLTSAFLVSQAIPVPFVTQPLVPSAVAPGTSQFTLTVNGTGFVPASIVIWNRDPLVTTYVNSSKLTATVPASNLTLRTTASVTVSSPGVTASNIVPFTVTQPSKGLTFSSSMVDVGPFPSTILATDFDGDGIPDLAVESGADPMNCYKYGFDGGRFQYLWVRATGRSLVSRQSA